MAFVWLTFVTVIFVAQCVDQQNFNLRDRRSEVHSSLSLAQRYRGRCNRKPQNYNTPKTPGDNGFQLKISGGPEKYVPGDIYTISIQGRKNQHRIQTFIGFMLVVEPSSKVNDLDISSRSSPNVGMFQLFGDALSKFSEECPHAVLQTSNIPKSEIQVMWTAPPPLSGCVVFKAMVIEIRELWYMDDGGLTKELCEEEQESRDRQPEIIANCCACNEAKYEVEFEGLWSRQTHPKDFPSNEWMTQFLDIIGASHTVNFRMWEYGGFATEGVRHLGEQGTSKKLESELKTQSEKIRTVIKARGLRYPNLNGKTFAVFRVDKTHHLISLLSKLNPSPDWFVGISALELCMKNCSWVTKKVMNLYPWDAGINDGRSYLSEPSPTIPQERIKVLISSDPETPFFDPTGNPMKPVVRLTITRQRIYEKSCEVTVSPNRIIVPFRKHLSYPDLRECAVTEWTDFTSCSVSCGRGIRLRTRSYVNEEKARTVECVTNLVEKKSCDTVCEKNVNCQKSDWSEWTSCNVTCGTGLRIRRRHYKNLIAYHVCREDLIEKETCTERRNCEVNNKCAVTQWSEWSPCTVTCGRGMKIRTRLYLLPSVLSLCNTELMQKTTCERESPACFSQFSDAREICTHPKNAGPCQGMFKRWYYDTNMQACIQFVYGGCRGNRNNFILYADCRKTCENMLRVPLTTHPTSPAETYDQIKMPSTDCQVSEWSEFSSCSATCGKARRIRRRRIEVYPQNGGSQCPKKLIQRRKCRNNVKCAVHCKLRSWSQWSSCSLSCGTGGFQERIRKVKRERKRGGLPCKPLIERKPCNVGKCPYK
ncbi:spondin-1-like [Tachypleus tridentatus]|uniref:spondin-1-like n=1 Tax=Tachypleus tridentatus TaxID=6853 RepID=UPI003FD32A95